MKAAQKAANSLRHNDKSVYGHELSQEERSRELRRLMEIDAIDTINYLIEECGWSAE